MDDSVEDGKIGAELPKPVVIPAPVLIVLRQLLVAWQYAQQLQRDIWDFAVERSTLKSVGVTNNDLRWLICQGFVEHSHDMTTPDKLHRMFSPPAGLRVTKESCFVLTREGRRVAEATVGTEVTNLFAGNPLPNAAPVLSSGGVKEELLSLPIWDGQRHQLRVGDWIVKEFKVNSPNQETILAAFQEEGWPPRIDDPLPVHAEIDPKRRLHDTIKGLNRNQRKRLIHFLGDGNGEAVRWEPSRADTRRGHAKIHHAAARAPR